MYRMSITQKGQLVIPKELRDKHGIKPNGSVMVTEIGDHIAIFPAIDPVRHGRGMLRLGKPATTLLQDARAEEFRKDKRILRPGPGRRNVRKG